MPWLRVDDAMWRNRKVMPVSPLAKCLWVWSMGYSADQLTDGILRPTDLRQIVAAIGIDDWTAPMQELVDAGLMEIGPDGTYIIHDYLDYNPPAEQVKKERAVAAARMQKLRSGYVSPNIPRTQPERNQNVINPVPGPVPPLLSLAPSTEDDPLVERLMQHGVTYTVGITLASGRDALATAWLDYVDGHPNIPNVAAYLTKNIRAGRKPPTTGPPGKPPPARRTGMSEADREVQRELERARKAEKHGRDGPAAPT